MKSRASWSQRLNVASVLKPGVATYTYPLMGRPVKSIGHTCGYSGLFPLGRGRV
jgi:hypothetical protein